ncbi:hypothetical protein Pla123a_24270 [Posidoniimonas polymericola]|uniref:Uncharacterized protein n=1 Tax=Posidoniimonas polymericola TaxID=2528002 RepID=A0A5C5YPX4_9BACT|nr:BBP7 family outer membrane beta-barrel protein [Posidoniimonas polymericola]TWT77001.1 hypothetical protein Pla123a_24270 [Posidoniimonas polymericola]
MFRSVVAAVALLACGLSGAAGHAANPDNSGVWMNGHYFGHNPAGRQTATALAARQGQNAATPAGYEQFPDPADADQAGFCEPLSDPVGCCDLGLSCCDSVGCGDCVAPGFRCRGVYGAVEYVYGWTKGANSPALVTTSDDATLQDDAGVLGLATTSVLFGGDDINDGGQSGGRATLGLNVSPYRNRRIEFVYAQLADGDDNFAASTGDFAILARPFFDTDAAANDALLSGFPSLASGDISVNASSDYRSYELLMRQDACCYRGADVELLVGYRATELDDTLAIDQSILALAGATAGATTDVLDQFSTSNTFHGGQVGLTCRLASGRRWSYDCSIKTALGTTRQKARVNGSTTVTASGGGVSTASGGLLTQATNIGEYSRDEFSAVSEVGLTLRYKLRRSTSLSLGYNIVFWTDVVRAAEQIDSSVNTTQIPPGTLTGEARPAFAFDSTSFWAQGFRAGLESRF